MDQNNTVNNNNTLINDAQIINPEIQKESIQREEEIQRDLKETYDVGFLLDRAYGSFTINVGKIKLVSPKCKDENKKTYVINFLEVCASINREPEELRKFISKELQMDTSIKGTGYLKIDGRLRNMKMIETLVRNFVMEHVMCKTCRSCKTKTEKDIGGRITYMICNACGCKKAI